MFVKLIQGHAVNRIQVQALVFPNSLLCSWLHRGLDLQKLAVLGKALSGQQIFSRSVTNGRYHRDNYWLASSLITSMHSWNDLSSPGWHLLTVVLGKESGHSKAMCLVTMKEFVNFALEEGERSTGPPPTDFSSCCGPSAPPPLRGFFNKFWKCYNFPS